MIYVTGDTHADFTRFSTNNFHEQKQMNKDDIVIVTGDFGIWHDNKEERWWLDWLDEKPFTTLFVDGNHSNFDRLYSDEFKTIDLFGGKAHQIRDSIFHLKRGYVFTIENKKFFCMGGASSHDISDGILDENDFDDRDKFLKTINLWRTQLKSFRVNHLSWWEQELPSKKEMDLGIKNLRKNNNEVDYVISHCFPQSINYTLGYEQGDTLTLYFDKLLNNGLKFKEWHGGHLHRMERVWGKFYIHYYDIMRLL